MKTLVSVAVFGLVPMPAMPDTLPDATGEDIDLPEVALSRRPITERLATNEEIARIRDELAEIDAK
jgi:hypothetical protein